MVEGATTRLATKVWQKRRIELPGGEVRHDSSKPEEIAKLIKEKRAARATPSQTSESGGVAWVLR
jgi:hypothetical protein